MNLFRAHAPEDRGGYGGSGEPYNGVLHSQRWHRTAFLIAREVRAACASMGPCTMLRQFELQRRKPRSAVRRPIESVRARLLCSLTAIVASLATSLCVASVNPPGADVSITDFQHTKWSAKDGAPSDTWAIAQTTDGWLWFAGPNGLYRFDGVRFERRDLYPGEPERSNAISALFALSSGELLVGHASGGISVLKQGHFMHYETPQILAAGGVGGITQDREGTLWAATSNGLLRFDGTAWSEVGAAWSYSGGYVADLAADSNGGIWISTRTGVFRLREGKSSFQRVDFDVKDSVALVKARDGLVWAVDDAGVHQLPGQFAALTRNARYLSETSYGALFDSQGVFWVWGRGQTSQFGVPKVLGIDSLGTIKTVMEDREGNLWFGDQFAVIHRLNRPTVSKLSGLPHVGAAFPWVALATASESAMWMAVTASGNTSVNDVDGIWIYGESAKRIQPSQISSATTIRRAPDGTVWIGGLEGLWKHVSGQFVRALELPASAKGRRILGLLIDASGNCWASVEGVGLLMHDGTTWNPNGGFTALPRTGLRAMDRDVQGAVWLGYADGTVAMVEPGRATLFGNGGRSPRRAVTVISGGRRVLIGYASGLSVYQGGRFVDFRASVSAAFKGITGIVQPDNGDVWLNSSVGAVRIKAASLLSATADKAVPVDVFDEEDGFPGILSFSPGGFFQSLAQATDGRLWFVGTSGIGLVNPDAAAAAVTAPKPEILRISSDDQEFDGHQPSVLRAGTRSVRFDYTAVKPIHADRLRFRYQLEGLEEQWTEAGSRREATYANLGPGTFRFLVSAAEEGQPWNERVTTAQVVIPPTFVQSKLFLALCVAVIGMFLMLFFRLRIAQVSARERGRMEDLMVERERIARELHDTLLQSVQGLILNVDLVVRALPKASVAREALGRALGDAQTLIDEGRDHIQGLRSAPDRHLDLEEALTTTAQSAAVGGGISFRIVAEGSRRELRADCLEGSYSIGREAILNAFRHSHAKTIEVELAYGDTDFRVRIRDDGVGIRRDAAATAAARGHWGLTGMGERAERLGATLNVWSRNSTGTELELIVPAGVAYEVVRSPWSIMRALRPRP